MSMICRLLGHAARPAHHHNQGLDFSICARCAIDLIRESGEEEWRLLPRGTRVVWRGGTMASSAAEVASRIHGAPPPRRHPLRMRPAILPAPGRYRDRRISSQAQLVRLCGRLMLSGIADYWTERWHRPAGMAPAGHHVIYLPAPPRARAKRRTAASRTSPAIASRVLHHRS